MAVEWTEAGNTRHGISWSELVDAATQKLGFGDPELLRIRGTDLQILEYFRIANNGELAELRNWMLQRMSPPDDAIRQSIIHTALAKLMKCRIFYTTNFDDFLERAFQLAGRRNRRIAIEAHAGATIANPDEVEIVKFHGDFSSPDRMVLSESEYERRLRLNDPMDYRLMADLLGRAVLFIGYSFRDWNVSYLFRLVNDQLGELPASLGGRRAYITVPDPSEFEIRLFAARNIEVIPVSSANSTSDVAELLSDLQR
jgi:hypothetical protein